jgi:hypothetical protein
MKISEYKTKYNLVDDDAEDTVEYDMKNTWIFRPDLSNGLTGNEVITMPHLLIMVCIFRSENVLRWKLLNFAIWNYRFF